MAQSLLLFGQSGMGKTTVLIDRLLNNTVRQGRGAFVFDPTGYITETILDATPEQRRKDIIIFDPTQEAVVSWNALELDDHPSTVAEVASDSIVDAWDYTDIQTPDMDLYLTFSLLPLIANNETFPQLPRFFRDKKYRSSLLETMHNEIVSQHWDWYDKASERDKRGEAKSSLNKLLLLLSDPRVFFVLNDKKPTLRLSELNNKILIVKTKGRMSLIASLMLSVLKHLDLDIDYYLDNVRDLAPYLVRELLTDATGPVTATLQYSTQVPEFLFDALIGTCPEKLIFRCSESDARFFDKTVPERDTVWCSEIEGFDTTPRHMARILPLDRKNLYFKLEPDFPILPRSRQDILTNHECNLTRVVK